MQNLESVLDNETHKLLWDFVILMDHLILARRLDQVIAYKKKDQKRTCRKVDFAVPADHRVKLNEHEERNKYQDIAREPKKLWNMKMTVISIPTGTLGTIPQSIIKETGRIRNQMLRRDHPDCSISKIGKNIE